MCVYIASKYTKDRFDLNPGSDLVKKKNRSVLSTGMLHVDEGKNTTLTQGVYYRSNLVCHLNIALTK